MKGGLESYLLLIFPLDLETCLDALPGLQEGLPLGHLPRIMGAHTGHVPTEQDKEAAEDLEYQSVFR